MLNLFFCSIFAKVKVYKEKLNAKCREVADLELQLETLQVRSIFQFGKRRGTNFYILIIF